jgi:hypothetical protein
VTGKAKPATRDEARAGFEPAELVRGQRSLTVEYRHHEDHWTATSPDLDGFAVSASTLPQLKTAARAVLDDWLDPAVQVSAVEIDDAPPDVTKKAEGRTRASSRWAPWRKAPAGRIKNKRREYTGREVKNPAYEPEPATEGGPVPEVVTRLWGDLDRAPKHVQFVWRSRTLSLETKLQLFEIYAAAVERDADEAEQKQRRA